MAHFQRGAQSPTRRYSRHNGSILGAGGRGEERLACGTVMEPLGPLPLVPRRRPLERVICCLLRKVTTCHKSLDSLKIPGIGGKSRGGDVYLYTLLVHVQSCGPSLSQYIRHLHRYYAPRANVSEQAPGLSILSLEPGRAQSLRCPQACRTHTLPSDASSRRVNDVAWYITWHGIFEQ